MGYGLPAAIGASVGSAREFEGKKPVWLIDGDGSFQMTSEELAAAFLDLAGQVLPGIMLRSLEHQVFQQMGKAAPLPVALIHGPGAHPVLKGHYGMGLVLLDQNRQTVSETARHRLLG